METRHYLDEIASVMDGKEWSADTLDAIAEILRAAGFSIRDSEEAL